MLKTMPVALVGLVLTACASQTAETQPGITTGQALAQLACPHRIAEAHAWVNHMPSANRAPKELIVDIRLAEATDTAIILKAPASTGETMILEIRNSPTAPEPGRLTYREPVPDPLPKKISFYCRGGEIANLTTIEKVY